MNKKAVMSEGVFMIYRIVLVTLIAVVVFGLSAIYYEYYINVRYTEAGILHREIVNCISPDGKLAPEKFSGFENKIMDYCKIKNTQRFFVNISVYGDKAVILRQGDNAAWAKEIFDANKQSQEIATYGPGYFTREYNVSMNNKDAKMVVEVFVSHE